MAAVSGEVHSVLAGATTSQLIVSILAAADTARHCRHQQ